MQWRGGGPDIGLSSLPLIQMPGTAVVSIRRLRGAELPDAVWSLAVLSANVELDSTDSSVIVSVSEMFKPTLVGNGTLQTWSQKTERLSNVPLIEPSVGISLDALERVLPVSYWGTLDGFQFPMERSAEIQGSISNSSVPVIVKPAIHSSTAEYGTIESEVSHTEAAVDASRIGHIQPVPETVPRQLFTGSLYIPPPNFGMVEDYLYRSGQPSELHFPFLEKKKLKRIIWLAPEEPSTTMLNFVEDQDIELIMLERESQRNPWDPLSEETVLSALHLILEPRGYPLMVMCSLGRHRTGTVIGCLRKLQRWNLTSIFGEYRRYAGAKTRQSNEQFIELFDTDLVCLPQERPSFMP